MAKKRRSTMRGVWWRAYVKSIRFCSQCGHRLKIRMVKEENCRRHVCVKCGQITYINPKVVVGLIPVMPDGSVVLLKRAIEPAVGKWTYPAGFQEMQESSSTGAVRETLEEVCARVKVQRLLGVYSYHDAGVVTVVYVGRVLKGQTPKPGIESQEVQLFKPGKIPWKELAFRSSVDALKDWKKC